MGEVWLTIQEIKRLLDAEFLVGQDKLSNEIQELFCGDLMSDVLAFDKERA